MILLFNVIILIKNYFLFSLDESHDKDDFKLTPELLKSFVLAESQHKLFIGQWYPPILFDTRIGNREGSKSHLYELRTVIYHSFIKK